jgi:hypothetical protein
MGRRIETLGAPSARFVLEQQAPHGIIVESMSSPWLYRLMTVNKASHKDAVSPQDTTTKRSNKEFVGHCNAFVSILEQLLLVVEVCNHWIQMICSLTMFLRLPTKVAASWM